MTDPKPLPLAALGATPAAFAVPAELAGERLDRAIAIQAPDLGLPSLSRSRVKALIEQGLVTISEAGVNAGPDETAVTIDDPSYRVKPGQHIGLVVPPAEEAVPQGQVIPLDIVYEDDDLIVLNKPAGMVVHPAPGNPDQTLVNALIAHCGDSLSGIGGVKRPGIVHRIDKDTSGLMVAAKTDPAHVGLAAQFARHSIDRRYKAIVAGVPRPAAGTIDAPLATLELCISCFILDESGRQIGLEVSGVASVKAGDSLQPVANPRDARWDHRPYFRNAVLRPGVPVTSSPYLSLASGRPCIAVTIAVPTEQGRCVVGVELDWSLERLPWPAAD